MSSPENLNEQPTPPQTAIIPKLMPPTVMPEMAYRNYEEEGMGPGGAPAAGISPSGILHALRRNWLLGLVIGLVLAPPLAALPYFALKLEYRARGLIRVSPHHRQLIFEVADHSGPAGRTDFKTYKNTQRQLILSPTVLSKAIDYVAKDSEGRVTYEISKLPVVRQEVDPVAWLQSKIQVTNPEDAEILVVSLALQDQVSAQRLVDAVIKCYFSEVVEAEKNDRFTRVTTLANVKRDWEAKAKSKREELRNKIESVGTGDSSTMTLAQQNATQQLALIKGKLLDSELELVRKESQLAALQASEKSKSGTGEAAPEAATSNANPAEATNGQADGKATETVATTAKPDSKAVAANGTDKPATVSNATGTDKGTAAPAATATETAKTVAGETGTATATAEGAPEKIPTEEEVQALLSDVQVQQMIRADIYGAQYLSEIERLAAYIKQVEKAYNKPSAVAKIIAPHLAKLDRARTDLVRRVAELQDQYEKNRVAGVAAGMPKHDFGPSAAGAYTKDSLQQEISVLRAVRARLEQELVKQITDSKNIGVSTNDVDMLRADVQGLEKVISDVNDELERTNIEVNASSRITQLGNVPLPVVGESKMRLPLTAAGGVFGLIAPLALLMGLDLRRNLVNSHKMINDLTVLPVLGAIPIIPRSVMTRIRRGTYSGSGSWQQRLAESANSVTSLLLHKLKQGGHRVVLITSGQPAEGKTSLTGHLATSLADSGYRTLIIDFDFRRPMIHRLFNLSLTPGATDVLRNGAKLEDCVQQGDSPNMHVLTAGSVAGSLMQDAANGSLQALFDLVRSQYDYVLVDSCPLMPVMDGRIVGQYTDCAVLSVIKDVSQVPCFIAANEILLKYGINGLGCVVTADCPEHYYSYTNIMQDKITA